MTKARKKDFFRCARNKGKARECKSFAKRKGEFVNR